MKRFLSILLIFALLIGATPIVASAKTPALGDVDNSGAINASDALLALKHAVGKGTLSAQQISACDVDYSGKVNATDALHILKYAVKKIYAFTPNLTGRVFMVGTVYPQHFDNSSDYAGAMQLGIKTAVGKYGVEEVLVEPIAMDELEQNLAYFDLVEMPSENARAFAKKGLLQNIANNTAIDWQAANSASTLSCTMGDMVCGVASPAMSAVPLGIAMNKPLLQRYAPVSFAKLQEQFTNGTWDFDALTALCEEYRKNRSYGKILISNTNIIGQAVFANCGYEVKFLEDGSGAVSSLATSEGIAALTYVKQLKSKGYFTYEANITSMLNDFYTGTIPMIAYNLAEVGRYMNGTLSLTAMPFPKGPDMDTYTMGAVGCSTFVMPKSPYTQDNACGAMMNCFLMANDNLATAIVTDSKEMGFDSLGQQVFRFAAEHTTADLSTGPFTSAVGSVIDGSVLDAGKNPSTAIPPIEKLIQREVDAYYGQFYTK